MRRLAAPEFGVEQVTQAIAEEHVAGDGDGDGDSITKSQLLAKGNAICRQANDEVEAALRRFEGRPSQAQIEAFVSETVIPSIQRQVDRIEALGAPEGDEDELEGIVADTQEILDRAKADPEVIVGAERSDGDPFADVNRRLTRYGLTECGRGIE